VEETKTIMLRSIATACLSCGNSIINSWTIYIIQSKTWIHCGLLVEFSCDSHKTLAL